MHFIVVPNLLVFELRSMRFTSNDQSIAVRWGLRLEQAGWPEDEPLTPQPALPLAKRGRRLPGRRGQPPGLILMALVSLSSSSLSSSSPSPSCSFSVHASALPTRTSCRTTRCINGNASTGLENAAVGVEAIRPMSKALCLSAHSLAGGQPGCRRSESMARARFTSFPRAAEMK